MCSGTPVQLQQGLWLADKRTQINRKQKPQPLPLANRGLWRAEQRQVNKAASGYGFCRYNHIFPNHWSNPYVAQDNRGMRRCDSYTMLHNCKLKLEFGSST